MLSSLLLCVDLCPFHLLWPGVSNIHVNWQHSVDEYDKRADRLQLLSDFGKTIMYSCNLPLGPFVIHACNSRMKDYVKFKCGRSIPMTCGESLRSYVTVMMSHHVMHRLHNVSILCC